MRRLSVLVAALFVFVLFASPVFSDPPPRPPSPQKSGMITGVVDYCGPSGVNGILVFIYGTSFMAKPTLGTGEFSLYWIPVGSYTLSVEIPNAQTASIENVDSADNTITDLGLLYICRDVDGDQFTEETDCNDYNENVNPDALEECDGIDNDCDGTVDEDCDICIDDDGDGFYAQEGCLTSVDCDDDNFLINPTAVELCDGLDNNCNGISDEGVDLTVDPANCGSCGNVCSFANANATCIGGTCYMGTCNQGYGDCDADPSNGCEASLNTTYDCGACGEACLDLPGSTVTCSPNGCEYTCVFGYEDCNGDLGYSGSDGCEVSIETSVTDCGACGVGCTNGPNIVSATCVNGMCFTECLFGFADCDFAVGCETNIWNNNQNCGSCGNVCGGLIDLCLNGQCAF